MRDIDWLLSGESWIEYKVRVDLLDEQIEFSSFKEEILRDTLVTKVIADLGEWSSAVMKNHKDSNHPIYKLAFLADIGVDDCDPNIKSIMNEVYSHKSDEGIFQVLANIPKHFGGSGVDEYAWMLCDAPTILYSIVKIDKRMEEEVIKATRHLISLQENNGWRCKVSGNLGKFRGPGKKADPCPYANLLMLKLIAELNTNEFDDKAQIAIESILDLWEHKSERKEYLFGMGTDFKKLKAPLIWFDILHVLDVLSKFSIIYEDRRFNEMVKVLEDKFIDNDRLKPESIFRPWKEWEFANKKEQSRWITFLGYRILKRSERHVEFSF